PGAGGCPADCRRLQRAMEVLLRDRPPDHSAEVRNVDRRQDIDSDGGQRTPSSAREALSTLPDKVLHDLAEAHGLDPTRYPNRISLIEALASLPDAELLLADAERRRVEFRIERFRRP